MSFGYTMHEWHCLESIQRFIYKSFSQFILSSFMLKSIFWANSHKNLVNNSHIIYQNLFFCLHSLILLTIFLCNQILFIFMHYDSETSHFKQYLSNTNVDIPPNRLILYVLSPSACFGLTSHPTLISSYHLFSWLFTAFNLSLTLFQVQICFSSLLPNLKEMGRTYYYYYLVSGHLI